LHITPPPPGRRCRSAAAAVAAAGATVGAAGMHVMWSHWLQAVRMSCAWHLQLMIACGPSLAVSRRDVTIWRVLQGFRAVTQASMS